MRRLDLSYEELGSAKLLIYNGNVSDLNNNIEHKNVLKFKRTTFVDVPLSYFDVSELVPLSDIQKYTLNKYDVLNMLRISSAVVNYCERQGIELQSVLFDSDYVFVDGKFNTYFLPLKTDRENNDYKEFLKKLLVDSIISPNYKDNFVQLILNCFNDPKFSLDSLIKLIDQITTNSPVDFENTTRSIRKEEIAPTTTRSHAKNIPSTPTKTVEEEIYPQNKFPNPYLNQNTNITNTPNTNDQITQKQPEQYVQQHSVQQEQPRQPAASLNTNHTQHDIYNQNKPQQPPQQQVSQGLPKEVYLISEENQNNKIYIDTEFFAIGRNPEVVNYPINSPYVGRMHAYIKNENGKFFIIDKNSTNGTYLNNQRLQPEFPQPLKSGDIIRFAKHSFQFNAIY